MTDLQRYADLPCIARTNDRPGLDRVAAPDARLSLLNCGTGEYRVLTQRLLQGLDYIHAFSPARVRHSVRIARVRAL
jgi:hypothetical protein